MEKLDDRLWGKHTFFIRIVRVASKPAGKFRKMCTSLMTLFLFLAISHNGSANLIFDTTNNLFSNPGEQDYCVDWKWFLHVGCWRGLAQLAFLIQSCLTVHRMPNVSSSYRGKDIYMKAVSWLRRVTFSHPMSHQGCWYDNDDIIAVSLFFHLHFFDFLFSVTVNNHCNASIFNSSICIYIYIFLLDILTCQHQNWIIRKQQKIPCTSLRIGFTH